MKKGKRMVKKPMPRSNHIFGYRSSIIWVILACALVGLIVSLISLNNHYSAHASFCTINEKIDCDVVNKGMYSNFFGVPVALWGVLGYLVFGLLVFKEKAVARLLSFSRKDVWLYLGVISSAMLAFALYLTGLELFVIHAICILCVTSQIVVLLQTICVWVVWKKAH